MDVITFCVYKIRLEFTVCGQTIHFRLDVPENDGVCVFKCSWLTLSQFSTSFFTREQCYASLQDNTGMLSGFLRSARLDQKEMPHLFLCAARVFELSARHCEFAPLTQASALILCQMKGYSNNVPCLTLLYQEIDELLPNPRGVHVFSSSCQEVERSEDDSSLLKGSDFRSIQPLRLMGEAKHTLVVCYTVCTAISEHCNS